MTGALNECVSYRPSRRVSGLASDGPSPRGQRRNFGDESLALFVLVFSAPGRVVAGGCCTVWAGRWPGQRLVGSGGVAAFSARGPLSARVGGYGPCHTFYTCHFGNERKDGWCWVTGAVPTRAYVSARGLAQLRERLSGRDVAIIQQVAELRLMSARQLQALHFPTAEHHNDLAATRARQRVLARLIRERLLIRLTRRIGGVRARSAGFVLALRGSLHRGRSRARAAHGLGVHGLRNRRLDDPPVAR